MRQKNMHLSPNTKKRKATANSYANLSAARAHPASLGTKLIGAPAVAAGVPPLNQMVATCCKRTCLNKVSFPKAACIMAVGGYSHLQKLHEAWDDASGDDLFDGGRALDAQQLAEVCDCC